MTTENFDFDGELALTEQGFLRIENAENSNPKIFVRKIGGKIRESTDFSLPVIHKKSVKILAWKDLGAGMLVPRVVENLGEKLGWGADAAVGFRAGAQLLRGFDEDAGQKYARVGKISAEQKSQFEKFVAAVGENLKIEEGRVAGVDLGPRAEEIFGENLGKISGGKSVGNREENWEKSGEGFLGVGEIENFWEKVGKNSEENRENSDGKIEIFGEKVWGFRWALLLLHGKLAVKNGAWLEAKRQIPLGAGQRKIGDFLEKFLEGFREAGIVISWARVGDAVFQVSTRDFQVLELLRGWAEKVEKIEEIASFEKSKFLSELLVAAVGSEKLAEIAAGGQRKFLEVE